MRLSSSTFAAALLLFSSINCAPRVSFQLSILNKTDQPVTVGVVKEGEPYEATLASPEQLAIQTSLEALPPWGHVIPPGRTLDSPPITGTFPRGAAAVLRVYRGEFTNAQLLAISNPSPDRAEVLLFPGLNQILIQDDRDKGLIVQRVKYKSP
jgi:hypothetical protein